MIINWVSYYVQNNGYGRFASRMVKALMTAGLQVVAMTQDDVDKPKWMLDMMGVSWDNLTITCMIPKGIKKVAGRHWLFTMCEGEKLSAYAIDKLHKTGIERVIVPSEFCRKVFLDSGLKLPIDVVPLGTDPDEFPFMGSIKKSPYTFFTIADRGNRKGWIEAYEAFYKAFGGKTNGIQDVRLIIKHQFPGNPLINLINRKGTDMDNRLIWDKTTYADMKDLYGKADCVVLPSRSEGWGLPHREAAMMGKPVILQKYAGLDDGHTEEWAICVTGGRMEPIPENQKTGGIGNWMIADTTRLAEEMKYCYDNPIEADHVGYHARKWLVENQTWDDSAAGLLSLIHREVGFYGSKMGSRSGSEIGTINRAVYEGNHSFG